MTDQEAFDKWHARCCPQCDLNCPHRGWEERAWLDACLHKDKQIEQLTAQLSQAREALRQIIIGKVQLDNIHPLGEWGSTAMRFIQIAKEALMRVEDE